MQTLLRVCATGRLVPAVNTTVLIVDVGPGRAGLWWTLGYPSCERTHAWMFTQPFDRRIITRQRLLIYLGMHSTVAGPAESRHIGPEGHQIMLASHPLGPVPCPRNQVVVSQGQATATTQLTALWCIIHVGRFLRHHQTPVTLGL